MLGVFIMMSASLTCIGAASIVFPASLVYLTNSIALVAILLLFGAHAIVSRKGFGDTTFPQVLLYFYGIPLFTVQPVLLNMNKGSYLFLMVMLLILSEKALSKGLCFDHGRLKCKMGVLFATILTVSIATISICKYQSWWLFGASLLILLLVVFLASKYGYRLVKVCTL